MGNDANRLKKLAAKAARRKALVADKRKVEALGSGLGGKIAVAALGPIEQCLMAAELFEMGTGTLVVARRLPTALFGCAFFLVDAFCLGVKDVFYHELSRGELTDYLDQMADQRFVAIDPAKARKLVRDAVAFADRIGLQPAKDFGTIERIFGAVDPADCTETFVFGQDGKPFFVAGPGDTRAKIRTVVETLDRHCGPGNWDYSIPFDQRPLVLAGRETLRESLDDDPT